MPSGRNAMERPAGMLPKGARPVRADCRRSPGGRLLPDIMKEKAAEQRLKQMVLMGLIREQTVVTEIPMPGRLKNRNSRAAMKR